MEGLVTEGNVCALCTLVNSPKFIANIYMSQKNIIEIVQMGAVLKYITAFTEVLLITLLTPLFFPDDELVMGLSELCGDGCPQQLIGCPLSLPPMDDLRDPGSDSCRPSATVQFQSQPSAMISQWTCGSPPSNHDDHCLPGSCFYQLHMRGGPFVSEDPNCGTLGSGTGAPNGLQLEFSLPSASPPSSAVLSSHFQAFGNLLHPASVQHSHSLTQWGDKGKSKLSGTLSDLPFLDLWWYLQRAYRNQEKKCIYLTLRKDGPITCAGGLLLHLNPLFKTRHLNLLYIVEVLITTFRCWLYVY